MALHNELGKWGEEYAVGYLRDKGYEIIQQDWRIGHRDIDIIARTPDRTTVVFVEVKTRTSDIITSLRMPSTYARYATLALLPMPT